MDGEKRKKSENSQSRSIGEEEGHESPNTSEMKEKKMEILGEGTGELKSQKKRESKLRRRAENCNNEKGIPSRKGT